MRIAVKAAIASLAAAGALALPAAASASTVPSNYPSVCNAGHGTPGGFGPASPYYTVAQSPNVTASQYTGYEFGQAQGNTTTGANNSSLGATCRSAK